MFFFNKNVMCVDALGLGVVSEMCVCVCEDVVKGVSVVLGGLLHTVGLCPGADMCVCMCVLL